MGETDSRKKPEVDTVPLSTRLETFGLRVFLEILEIYRLVCILLWVFGCFECVSSMFCLKLLLILNFTNTVLIKTTFRSIFVS